MKTLALIPLICLVILSSSGCVFMSDEDRDFYGKGWVKPSELDHMDDQHYYHDPSQLGTPSGANHRDSRAVPADY